MRPKRIVYTLANISTTGFATGLTGAGPFTTFSSPGDSTEHLVSLASTANLSTITLTITGKDSEGRTISETVTAPNNNTVNTTLYYASITSISASATLGVNTLDVGWADACRTPIFPLDCYSLAAPIVAIQVSGTIDYFVSQTNRQAQSATASDFLSSGPPDSSASSYLVLTAGITAARVEVVSHTSAVLTVTYAQTGYAS